MHLNLEHNAARKSKDIKLVSNMVYLDLLKWIKEYQRFPVPQSMNSVIMFFMTVFKFWLLRGFHLQEAQHAMCAYVMLN